MTQLYYSAEITDPEAVKAIEKQKYHVSIEAEVSSNNVVCNGSDNDCFNMPSGLKFVGLALTQHPGIPESTVNTLDTMKESFVGFPKHIHKDQHLYIGQDTNSYMTNSTAKTVKEADMDTPMDCPEGYKFDDAAGECMPMTTEAKKMEAIIAKRKQLKEVSDDSRKDAGVSNEEPSETPCPDGQKWLNGKCVPEDNVNEMTDDDDKKKKKDECDCDKKKESLADVIVTGFSSICIRY